MVVETREWRHTDIDEPPMQHRWMDMDPLDTTKMKTHPRVFVVDGSTWLVLFLDHCPYRLALPLHLLLLLLLLLAFIALVAAAALFVLVSVMLVSATDTRKDCESIVTSATKYEKRHNDSADK